MEVNGNTSNAKWSPTHLEGTFMKMHVGIAKASDVPDFALCAQFEKLTKENLAGQKKFTGHTLNLYLLSNCMVLPHGRRWIEGITSHT